MIIKYYEHELSQRILETTATLNMYVVNCSLDDKKYLDGNEIMDRPGEFAFACDVSRGHLNKSTNYCY